VAHSLRTATRATDISSRLARIDHEFEAAGPEFL
jgi:hypothetical protein